MNSIVLGITGASALQLAERSLELLLKNDKEIDLILSKGAYKVFNEERGIKIPANMELQELYEGRPSRPEDMEMMKDLNE